MKNKKSSKGIREADQDQDENEDEDQYEVEKIISKKIEKGKELYEVKWVGWPSKYNTFEPLEHLTSPTVQEMVANFNSKNDKKKKDKVKEKVADKSILGKKRNFEDFLDGSIDQERIIESAKKSKSYIDTFLNEESSPNTHKNEYSKNANGTLKAVRKCAPSFEEDKSDIQMLSESENNQNADEQDSIIQDTEPMVNTKILKSEQKKK